MIEVSSRRCSGRWRRYPMRTWPRPIGPLLARPGRRRAHGCAPRDSGGSPGPTETRTDSEDQHARRATDGPGKHRPLKGPSRPSGSRTTRCTPVGTGPTAAHRQHPGPRRLSRSICWGFLHGPTLHCEPDTIVEVDPLVTGPSSSTICMSAGPSPFPVYAHTRTSVHRQP